MTNIAWTTGVATCLLAGSMTQDPGGREGEGKLIRVSPRAGATQAGSRAPDPAASNGQQRQRLQLQDWSSRLESEDLDERERAFDEIVAAAQGDPDLRGALDEWSRDDSRRELAWTARLAMRELRALDARSGAWGGLPGMVLPGLGGAPGYDPFGWNGFGLDPFGRGAWPDPQELLERFRADFDGPQPTSPDASSSFESTSLEIGDDGVTCTITKKVDGEDVTEVYTAKSVEELLEAHPELRERLQYQFIAPNAFRGNPGRWPWTEGFGLPGRGSIAPSTGAVRTDVLGVVVVPLTPEMSKSLALEPGQGVRIERVEPGTIAAQLGLQRGHVLVEIDGQPIRSREDITSRLATRAPDGSLEIKLIDRWGQERKRVWKPDAAKQI